MQLLANAKINLFLEITGKRQDGYHLLDSQFYFTNLADVIEISPSNNTKDNFKCQSAQSIGLNIDKNSITKALELYRAAFATKTYYNIELHKNIPTGAGLGGGSSDAAAIIYQLAVENKNLNQTEKLHSIASSIGADVNVCLEHLFTKHRLFNVQGIGEQITKATDSLNINGKYLVLVYPNKALSTPEVFRHYSINYHPSKCHNQDSQKLNHLQLASISILPQIADILNNLNKLSSCHIARMSGSGSTCFGIYNQVPSKEKLERLFPDMFIYQEQIKI